MKEKIVPRVEKLSAIEGLLEQVWTAQQMTPKANPAEDAQPEASQPSADGGAPAEGTEGEQATKKSRVEKPASVVLDATMFRQLILAVKELRTPSGASSDDEPILERAIMHV